MGGYCPWEDIVHGGGGGILSKGDVVRGGGYCPWGGGGGGYCSRGDVVQGGMLSGGSCPGDLVWGDIVRVDIVLSPFIKRQLVINFNTKKFD